MQILNKIKDKYKNIDFLVVLIVVISVVLRLLFIDLKPLHHDEGVNGWFSEQVFFKGYYEYDPTNYHGPIIFYPILLLQALFGRQIWILRFPSAIVGILTILLVFKFSKFFGKRVATVAAFCMAVSPANVFYSRYVSFDSHLVLFSILIFYGIVGLWYENTKKYLYAIGIGIAGLIITKETFVLYIGCFIIALFCLFTLEQINPSVEVSQAKKTWANKDVIKVCIISFFIIFFSYTGGLLEPFGFFKLFNALTAWVSTGTQVGGHEKPFYYWLKLLLDYEQIALIALCLIPIYYFKSPKWIRYIAIYGFGVFLAHSIVPYKTPWIIINFLWPFYFIIGDIVDRFSNSQYRVYLISIFAIAILLSVTSAIRVSFFTCDSDKEPYVYVHTYKHINKLLDPLYKMAKLNPENYGLSGNIVRENYWPLPYLLNDFHNVGYYDPGKYPTKYDADFLFVQNSRIREIESSLKKKYFTEIFQMRNSQDPSKLYLSYDKFKILFPNRSPEFKGVESNTVKNGLLARFYPNTTWSGNPKSTEKVPYVGFHWEGDYRPFPNSFSVDFIGKINLPSNIVKFILIADDGGFLEIDGKRILDDPGPHGAIEKEVTYSGESGLKDIRVGLYDIGGGAIINLLWIDEHGNKVIIPNQYFESLGVK